MSREAPDVALLQGTLDMLVLRTVARGPLHGYAIARQIERTTKDALRVEEGSLYPALHRMEHRGWLAGAWKASEHNRRARFYHLTPEGRRHLSAVTSSWQAFVRAVQRILRGAPETT